MTDFRSIMKKWNARRSYDISFIYINKIDDLKRTKFHHLSMYIIYERGIVFKLDIIKNYKRTNDSFYPILSTDSIHEN